jgi:serine/threonine-protein kinase HipA
MIEPTDEWEGPVAEADVYKAGVLAARLTRTPDGVRFSYLDHYLSESHDRHPAVATTLPKSDQAVITPAGAVPPFFAGLLPEGRRLAQLRRRIKTSADDELSLLVAVGQDTVGDVQVVRRGTKPGIPGQPAPVPTDPATISFADLLADDIPLDGVGLAGVQDKVSGKTIAMPVKHKNRDTILKLSPPEYPHLVENEAYFLTLAKKAGIACVDHSVIYDRDGVSGLVVSRFDRQPSHVSTNTAPGIVAVEDACQVLGLWPADKYNTTTENVLMALSKLCAANLVALRLAFEQVVFAVLTGNGDLHAKNLSIMQQDGEWVLAPAYDIPSTVVYGDTSFGLTIGGKRRDVSRRQLVAFAHSLGLPTKIAERIITALLDATAHVEEDLRSGALPLNSRQVADTVAALRNRRRLLSSS